VLSTEKQDLVSFWSQNCYMTYRHAVSQIL